MFAMVNVPVWATVFAVLVVPVLTELTEPVAYLGGYYQAADDEPRRSHAPDCRKR